MGFLNSSLEPNEETSKPLPQHRLLDELAETELAALAGSAGDLPVGEGSGLCDVRRRHDRYLAGLEKQYDPANSGFGTTYSD